MMCFLNFAVKVRCHKWAVEIFAIRKKRDGWAPGFAANAPPGPLLAGEARGRPFSRDGFSMNWNLFVE